MRSISKPDKWSGHPVESTTACSAAWVHVAVTHSALSSTWSLYIDGKLENSAAGAYVQSQNAVDIRIGTGPNDSNDDYYYFPGILDEIAIFKKVLDATDIAVLYSSTALPTGAPSLEPTSEPAG